MNGTIRLAKNNTRLVIRQVLKVDGVAIDLSALTVKFSLIDTISTAVVAATTTGVTQQATFAFTASATTDRLTTTDSRVRTGDIVILATSGTLPAGLASATKYYARDVVDYSFKLSAMPDGAPINITDAGSGSHTVYILGEAGFAPATADVDTVGTYRGWFSTFLSTEWMDHEPLAIQIYDPAIYP